MIENREIVHIVDDDHDARESVEALVASMGMHTQTHASAEDFLRDFDLSWQGCVVIDLCLPGMSGLELHEQLVKAGSSLSVVMISAHANVPTAVRAMQNGAVTFIEKPCRNNELTDAIRKGLDVARRQRVRRAEHERFWEKLKKLTESERAVLHDILEDKPNRTIAKSLSVSLRTVCRLRSNVFEKLGVMSATDLARLIAENGMPKAPPLRSHCEDHFSSESA